MKIFGAIVIIVGAALLLAGRITARSLPPNYSAEDGDGFAELLQSVGKCIGVIGWVFLAAGILCVLL